jgi:putative hydrolase of the HAD superfamily
MLPEPELILIDLDGTVYPNNNGIWEQMSHNIEAYMVERLGIAANKTHPLRERLYSTYGTTLRGLQTEFHIDPEDYLSYIHDFEAEAFISPNLPLRDALESLPQPKWIFTNSDRMHSERILKALGIADLFLGIIDVVALDFIPKPTPQAYTRAVEIAGGAAPGHTMFIEDSLRNLSAAKSLGWQTVWITEHKHAPDVDYILPRLEDIGLIQWNGAYGN